jgi:hypothetical protein
MNTFLRDEAMRFLGPHRGRDKAIPGDELEYHLRLFSADLAERTVRRIYASLPICSCVDGLFVPKTSREVLDFQAYISKAHGPIIAARRLSIIYSYYPNLRPPTEEVQLTLDFDRRQEESAARAIGLGD